MVFRKLVPRALLVAFAGAAACWSAGIDVVRGRANALLAAAWQASGEAVVAGDLEALDWMVARARADLQGAQALRGELTRKRQRLQARRDAIDADRARGGAVPEQVAALLAQCGGRIVVDGRVYERPRIEAAAGAPLRPDLVAGDEPAELDAGLAALDGLIREVDREIRLAEGALRAREGRFCLLEAGALTARVRRGLTGADADPSWDARAERVARILFGPAGAGASRPSAVDRGGLAAPSGIVAAGLGRD